MSAPPVPVARPAKLFEQREDFTWHHMRIVVHWMYDLANDLLVSDDAFVRAAELFCLAIGALPHKEKKDYQGIACACFCFAAQIEDSWQGNNKLAPHVLLAELTDNNYTPQIVLEHMRDVLDALGGDVAVPTPMQLLPVSNGASRTLLVIATGWCGDAWTATATEVADAACAAAQACTGGKVEVSPLAKKVLDAALEVLNGGDAAAGLGRRALREAGIAGEAVRKACSGTSAATEQAPARAATGTLSPVTHIPAFIVTEKIGYGTFAKVYRAKAFDVCEDVALKVAKADACNSSPPETYVVELAVLARLSRERCPNIVGVLGWGEHAGRWALALRFEAGGTLERLLQRRAVSKVRRRTFLEHLLTAAACVHAHGFVHLDIKPENVLVRGEETAVLADFGIAEPYGPSRRGSNPVQTLWYRAPEVFLGEEIRTPSLDVWSVGIVFADMLEGRRSPTATTTVHKEREQLSNFMSVLGTPKVWERAKTLPEWDKYKDLWETTHVPDLKKAFPDACPSELSLLADMTQFDPSLRPSASRVLMNSYFRKRKALDE